MPTERTITVYKLDELSPAARKKAIASLQDDLNQTFDSSELTEFFKAQLDEYELPSGDIRWSLSSSQGDGVAFYGNLDLPRYLKKRGLLGKYKSIAKFFDDISVKIIKAQAFHQYDHWNTMRVELDAPHTTAAQEKRFNQLEADILEHIQAVSRELERLGYKEIEYQTSEEVAVEMADANDYEFDEQGNQI